MRARKQSTVITLTNNSWSTTKTTTKNGRKRTEVSFDGRGFHYVRHFQLKEERAWLVPSADLHVKPGKRTKQVTKQPQSCFVAHTRRDGTCVSRCHTNLEHELCVTKGRRRQEWLCHRGCKCKESKKSLNLFKCTGGILAVGGSGWQFFFPKKKKERKKTKCWKNWCIIPPPQFVYFQKWIFTILAPAENT